MDVCVGRQAHGDVIYGFMQNRDWDACVEFYCVRVAALCGCGCGVWVRGQCPVLTEIDRSTSIDRIIVASTARPR